MPQDAGVFLLSHPESGTIVQSERAILLAELRAWQVTHRTVVQSIARLQKRLAEIEAAACECERIEMMA
jgi:chaperonin cofactor prefoldin